MERKNDISAIPPMVVDSMLLVPNERVDRAWKATFRPPAQEEKTPSSLSGFLVLTNNRLFFVAERGVLSTRYGVALTIDYEDIVGIEQGAYFDSLVVSHKGAFSPVAFEYFLEPSETATNLPGMVTRWVPSKVIRGHLELLIKTRMNELEEHDHGPSKLVLDFGFLKSVLEKGGIVARSLKCPSCGADLTVPGDGATIKLDYCGSSVEALDMLERIRAMLDAIDTFGTKGPE